MPTSQFLAVTFSFAEAGEEISATTLFVDSKWGCAAPSTCGPLDAAEHQLAHGIEFIAAVEKSIGQINVNSPSSLLRQMEMRVNTHLLALTDIAFSIQPNDAIARSLLSLHAADPEDRMDVYLKYVSAAWNTVEAANTNFQFGNLPPWDVDWTVIERKPELQDISYQGLQTPVPEPATWAPLCVLLVLGATLRRRRARAS